MGITRYMRGIAYRRGVVGANRNWLAMWIALTGLNWLRRHAGKTEPKAVRLKLEPGERFLVSNEPPERR